MNRPVTELLRDPSVDQAPDEATVRTEADVFFAEHPWSELRATLAERLADPAKELGDSWLERLRAALLGRPGFVAIAAVAAAAALMVLQPSGPSVRPKGGVDLSFVVRRGDAVVPGDPEALYAAGDRLQLRYSTAAHTHVVVLGHDGAGRFSPWYEQRGMSVPISPGRDRLLDGSVILDESPGPERVYACFSKVPVPVADLATSLARGLEPPLACEMVELTLRKR